MPVRNPIWRVAASSLAVAASVSCSSPESSDDAAADTTSTRIVIEGQARTVEGETVCTAGPTGEVSIEVDPVQPDSAATKPQPIVVLDLTPQGDTPVVSLLAITLPDIGLSAGRYRTAGVPTASKEGNTYTVSGQASVVGTPPARPVYKSFELELTCP
jgi:lipoprotein antigen